MAVLNNSFVNHGSERKMFNDENVVENTVSTENVDSDLITVRREDYERLVYERNEYRSIALAYDEKFTSMQSKFLEGGVASE